MGDDRVTRSRVGSGRSGGQSIVMSVSEGGAQRPATRAKWIRKRAIGNEADERNRGAMR